MKSARNPPNSGVRDTWYLDGNSQTEGVIYLDPKHNIMISNFVIIELRKFNSYQLSTYPLQYLLGHC